MGKKILSLTTLAEEPNYIEIDGEEHQLLQPKDFGILETVELLRMANKIEPLTQMADAMVNESIKMDGKKVKAMYTALDSFVLSILPTAKGKIGKLSIFDKISIFAAFFSVTPMKSLTQMVQAAALMEAVPQSPKELNAD